MRAIVQGPAGLAFADVPEPVPGPGEVLVAVRAAALNFADLAYAGRRPDGSVPGNDVAGVVLRTAPGGPAEGTLVAGFAGGGGWAQRCVLGVDQLAAVPAGVDPVAAAALPAAGVTALRAVRALGPVLGRRVLVTGASGGVGRYGVQLAALAGAHVVAAAGRPAGLAGLGAAEVVPDLAGLAPVDGVLDTVGGPLLAAAAGRLTAGGLLLAIGAAGGVATTLDLEALRNDAPGARVEAFNVGAGGPFGADLATLLGLVRAGRLDPQVGRRGPWTDVHGAAAALAGRRVAGKAVLEIGQ
jgi:NADPH:quinone reductase